MITNTPVDKLTHAHLKVANVPDNYWTASIGDFEADYRGLRPAKLFADSLVKNLRDGVGLMFWGTTGHGKTHLAVAVLKRALAHNARCLFIEAPSIQGATIEKEQLDYLSVPLAKAAEMVDLLVLDDVGAEHTSGFSKTLVEKLIRFRGTRNRSTLITTNLKPASLGAIYGDGFISALKEYVYPTRVHGRDWREDKANELRSRFEA